MIVIWTDVSGRGQGPYFRIKAHHLKCRPMPMNEVLELYGKSMDNDNDRISILQFGLSTVSNRDNKRINDIVYRFIQATWEHEYHSFLSKIT